MQPEISILITAIDRPELHSMVVDKYSKYVDVANCKWNITINSIFGKHLDTENNFKTILKDSNVDIKVFETGGSRKDWYQSVKHVINTSYLDNPKLGYLWLEDDWLLTSDTTLSQDIQLLTKENSYIALANRNEISFNPGIWSKFVFENLMYNSINEPKKSLGNRYIDGDNTNVERLCCPQPAATKFVENFHILNRFKDIGREWQNYTIKTRSFNLK